MNLIKTHWAQDDIKPFQEYLCSFSKGEEKAMWEKRIVNTNMKCLAVPSPVIKKMVNEIAKGNFLEFLDLQIWETLSNTFINAGLICKIKDFSLMEKYLTKYAKKCDNWASTDTLKFKITDKNKQDFFGLSKTYIKSKQPFVRRLGLLILLKLENFDEFTDETLNILKMFYDEKEYYVNMMNAWLVCESFIKHRHKTLLLLKQKCLNPFTQNKAISKCRDSFRVTKEDKEFLKTLRI